MCSCLLAISSAVLNASQLDDSNHADIIDHLKTGVAWGLVPLGSEIAINSLDMYLKHNKLSFLLKLSAVHKNNIRRATSQHLTDNISARLESVCYKTLSDDHSKKKTDELQTDLLYQSLFTFSVLSSHAQKARKTFYRLLDIIDTVSHSAGLSLSRGDEEQAAALMALNALAMVYLHPEIPARDVLNSIYTNFSKPVSWPDHPDFRSRVTSHLKAMDPLMQQSAIMKLRYCDILNVWKIGDENCQQLEEGALGELKSLASDSNLEDVGFVKKLLKTIPRDEVRTSIFILGVSLPGVFLYFVENKHFAIDVVTKHFAKVAGLATTKENMERFASRSRRTLENWGAINTGSSVNRTSGITEHINQYFSYLQQKAGMILAEQPNFARSNSQRALELMVTHFSSAHRNPENKASILAAALIQSHVEMVEVNANDTVIRAAIMAYQPITKTSDIVEVNKEVKALGSEFFDSTTDFTSGYKAHLEHWAKISLDKKSTASEPWGSNEENDYCTIDRCPPQEKSQSEQAYWYSHYLPTPESVTTAIVHSAALGYSMGVALIQPFAIGKLARSGSPQSYWQLSTYYFLLSMFDFGLRSVGEPAIVHLQTVVKNWIGGTTGILDLEDLKIQSQLAAKVNILNRKLSIEAQTSRSYKMTMEVILLKYWSLAAELLMNQKQKYAESSRLLAYAAYTLRHYHPEFESTSEVIVTLANSRLSGAKNLLQQKNLMQMYAEQTLFYLAELDPDYQDKNVKRDYLEILNSWGIQCDQSDAQYADDVLDSWVVYGDYILGTTGFLLQSVIKAISHHQGLISRSIVHFLANTLEFGTTDPLRKRIYAYSRQAMLNVATPDTDDEQLAARYANEELTNSFRRQKFYFGKPELDSRTQLVQLITSVTQCLSEARFLIAAHEMDRATDQIASGLVRVILYAPDISSDNSHLKKAVMVLTASYQDQLKTETETILSKVSEQLSSAFNMDSDTYSSAMSKATLMLQTWSK